MTERSQRGRASGSPAHDQVEQLLGRVRMSELRKRFRDRGPAAADEIALRPRLVDTERQPWLRRSVRHPIALLFLFLGASTTLSLVFAASRLADDGTFSVSDWFRMIVVGIIAAAFFLQVLAVLGRLPGVRRIKRAMKHKAQPRPRSQIAAIPSVDADEDLLPLSDGFGRLTPAERARIRTQTVLDDLFWIGITLALLSFGAVAAYGLGSSALRAIVSGGADAWSYIRVVLLALTLMGLTRLLRGAIRLLRSRRQRRRKRAVRRLLRYLLWWDRPTQALDTTSRVGPIGLVLSGLTPFVLCCWIAATAAAYSPWGERSVEEIDGGAVPSASAEAQRDDSPSDEILGPEVLSDSDSEFGLVPIEDPEPVEPTVVSNLAAEEDPSPTSTSLHAGTTTTLTAGSPTTAAEPTGAAPTVTTATSTTTASPPGTVATATTATATTVATTATATTVATTATATTVATTATATTVATTTAAPTTTQAPTSTTTTQPPAPLMVVSFLNDGFFCDGGTTRRTVTWAVSGDPGGQVNIFRLRDNGEFVQIGSKVPFNGSTVDTPSTNGSYQYWVIAANSQAVDTVRKSPSAGFFTFTAGSCIA